MEIPILQDLAVLFALSIGVSLLSHQLGLPPLIGYLATGLLAGPTGLGLIHGHHEVEALAEIGVILLLFAIGLEFSFAELAKIKRAVLIGGSLQMGLSFLGAGALALALGEPAREAIFIGLLVALSSTAIVLKQFGEQGLLESAAGKQGLGILIFQDLAIVPLMLLIPFLAGQSGNGRGWEILVAEGLALVVGVFVLAKWVVPWGLYRITATRSRELFLLSICSIGLLVAWSTQQLGLSLGLGAFLAGLIISESEYSLSALSSIIPFRDVFASLFFISIGMLLDLGFFAQNWGSVVALVVSVLLIKGLVLGIVGWVLKANRATQWILALSLSQIGEFSFVLVKGGVSVSLMDEPSYQLFLAVSVVTMALAPVLIQNAPKWGEKWFPEPSLKAKLTEVGLIEDHLILVGYGVTGQMLARAAVAAGTAYQIIELNSETVRQQAKLGQPIHFGDSTHPEVLLHVGIKKARVLVIAIPDAMATEATIRLAKNLAPGVKVIARARHLMQLDHLYKAGADLVVPAEYEASIEIFAQVLDQYLVPHVEIERAVREIRAEGYQMLRRVASPRAQSFDLQRHLSGLEIRWITIGERLASCHRLIDLDLRARFGVTVLAIKEGAGVAANPQAQAHICPGNEVLLLGKPEEIIKTAHFLEAGEPEPDP